VTTIGRLLLSLMSVVMVVAGCSSGDSGGNGAPPPAPQHGWVEDEVTFSADGLTIHGTYRHDVGAPRGPAAVLVSESGNTDRNGDNAVAGPVGNMRQLAEYLSGKGIASLRYDKAGTGKTGLGPYALRPADVGSAVYTAGAKAAVRYLAGQPGTDVARISAYALGEGGIHAMALVDDTAPDAPKIHSLGLLQPLAGRYLDIISGRVRAGLDGDVNAGAKTREQADEVLKTWTAAVDEARTKGTAPAQLPEGLGAILNPSNVKAVVEADSIDPVELAAKLPAAMPVLATCSDSDVQAMCSAEKPLFDALGHTALTVVEFKGVNHVLRDDPTDNVGNYAKHDPLSPQLVTALDGFVTK
jgi:alpha-beta hydrolase superfamily lysophospholipase